MALLKFLLLFPYGMMGKTIVCDGGLNEKCYKKTVGCRITDYDCTVYCNSTYGCYQTTIDCTLADRCTVHIATDDWTPNGPSIYCGDSCNINATSGNGLSIHLPAYSNSSIVCDDTKTNGACSSNTSIEVDQNAIVNILCKGYNACHHMRVNAISKNTILNITCFEEQDSHGNCQLMEITAGSNSRINLLCTGEGDALYPCEGAYINGGPNSSINMLCSFEPMVNGSYKFGDGCRGNHIIGQSGSNINMSCLGFTTCMDIEINGRDAASLTLNGCEGYVHCGMAIWCPQHLNGEKRCHLGRGENLQISELYAVNSWDDVELLSPIICFNSAATMYCSTNFTESCIFGGMKELEALPYSAIPCDDYSSGCCVAQQPNDTFTTCAVSEGTCKAPDHMSTLLIVFIVICILVGVGVLVGILWVIYVLRKLCLKNSSSNDTNPISEESDAFVQSEDL